MKKSLVLLLLFPLLAVSQKNFKLVEQSQTQKPNWLTESNYSEAFIIQAERKATLKEAEESAMTILLNNIASSIAVHVTGRTDVKTEEYTKGGNGIHTESFQSTIVVEIEEMPALQGISLSKAMKYWERYYNKKTKETYYDYYILYPFTSQDLNSLIEEYNKIKSMPQYPLEWGNYTNQDFIYDIQEEKRNSNVPDTELKKKLLDIARINITKQIQVKIENNSSESKQTSTTDLDLSLIETKSHLNSKMNKIFVIAYVNKPNAVRFYQKQIDIILNNIKKHVSITDDYIETGFLSKAKEEITKAENELTKLKKNIFFLTIFDCSENELQNILQRYNEHEQVVKRKITDMKYGTKIYVQCYADIFGQNYMSLSKELKSKLSEMGCNFVDDKNLADWAIIINANSREYNKVIRGSISNHFSYVDAEITLEKVVTNQRIYEDILTEKGGHTHNYNEAARDAYKKITPKIINLIIENIKQ